ncbi:MAG: hypothetical protein FWD03_01995 [Defluviitaleaceae bacterium]|nr:hypothetical protein [Defluviitaleaceae bacterium]
MSKPNEAPLCQSCAMPMDTPEKFGQDADVARERIMEVFPKLKRWAAAEK